MSFGQVLGIIAADHLNLLRLQLAQLLVPELGLEVEVSIAIPCDCDDEQPVEQTVN